MGGGGFGEGLNQIRERARASQPKNLPSSPLTDVRCALETDHSGCNLEEVRVPSNFQEALPVGHPPPPHPHSISHYFVLFACVRRETPGRAQRAKMAAPDSPFPAFHVALQPPPRHSQSILGRHLSLDAVEFFAVRWRFPPKGASSQVGFLPSLSVSPTRTQCIDVTSALRHTHTHTRTTSLCLHSSQSK